MELNHTIAIHITFATTAILVGPLAIYARMGPVQRVRFHRAFGYTWVSSMLGAAVTGLFIRDYQLPNILGYTPIHLFIPITLIGFWRSFSYLRMGNIKGHQITMLCLYFFACVVTGLFTLLPSRYLGNLLWN